MKFNIKNPMIKEIGIGLFIIYNILWLIMKPSQLTIYTNQGILPKQGEHLDHYVRRAERTLRVLDFICGELGRGMNLGDFNKKLYW